MATVTLTAATSSPTLLAFGGGILGFSQPGAVPAAGLEQVGAGVRALDMDDVRRHLSAPASVDPSLARS